MPPAADLGPVIGPVIGTGQKVFDAPAVQGRIRHLEGVDGVLDLMDSGAEGTVVVVRDAGATFLAPLYHELAGVICTAGTLRSHIGIVTREFGVPCVMGCVFTEVPSDDDVVELDCSGGAGVVRAVGPPS